MESALSSQEKAIHLGHPSYLWRFGQERRLALIERYAPLSGKRILDVGCGLGMYTRAMRALGGKVYGVELDAEKVAQAGEEKAFIAVGKAEVLPFPKDAFDVILLHEVLEHVDDDRKTVQEAFRSLKAGGRIVIFAPNRLYPFETHGIYLGSRYVFGNIPLVGYLPNGLRRRLCPHVRSYTSSQLRQLFGDLPAKVVVHTQIFPGYDKLSHRWPLLGGLIRRATYALEGSPLTRLGLSHLLVMEKPA